jgi:hypothetical protein
MAPGLKVSRQYRSNSGFDGGWGARLLPFALVRPVEAGRAAFPRGTDRFLVAIR